MTNRSALGILVLGLLALLTLMLVYQLRWSHESALNRATDDADNLAFTLDGQITATLRRIDSTLNTIAGQLPEAALEAGSAGQNRQRVQRILGPLTHNFPEILGLFVWDKRGDLLYDTISSFPLAERRSIGHRPGFQELLKNPRATLTFSDSIRSIMTGHQTIAVYVPVRDKRGQVLAVVTATLNLDHIGQIFKSLHLGPRSVVFMRRSDNHKMVIRYPLREGEINRPVRNALQQRIDAGELAGRDQFRAVTDGENRLYGFRKLQNYPFYVVVGVSQSDALANWYRNAAFVAGGLLLLVSALLLALLRMRRIEKLKDAAQQEAVKAHRLLQEAINSISAGLIIYDEQDRMVMCNEAMFQIFGGLREQIIPGRTFADITREGAQRGIFVDSIGQIDAWLAERMRQHRATDGRAHEMALKDGRWVQFSEHRTPSGYTVGSRIDITERKRLESELKELATMDALTGLPNRRHFMNRLQEELERVQRRTTQQASVLMLDLDHFKGINDVHGHAGGDRVLGHFADLLRDQLRLSDSCGRIGGEEFAVVLAGSDMEAARHFAERLRRKLEETELMIGTQNVRVTVSIGITAILDGDTSPDTVLMRADTVLYQAKDQGRNRVVTDPVVNRP